MTPIIGTCHLCCITAKLSSEHIIPQSLGGVLAEQLYCEACNSKCGHSMDVELARQFGPCDTLLRIERKRGRNQPFSIFCNDTGLELSFDGENITRAEPNVYISQDDSGTIRELDVRARSTPELKKIVKGVARRYTINPNYAKFENVENPAPTVSRKFVVNNESIRQAIAKITYGFACTKLPIETILGPAFDDIRAFILGRIETKLVSPNYVDGDFMVDNIRPLHKLHFALNREEHLLVGYVTLFGTFRYTVLLSDSVESPLEWPGFDYTYNPVTRKEVPGNPNFRAPPLTRQEVVAPKQSGEQVNTALQKGWEIVAAHSPAMGQVLSVGVAGEKP